MALLNDRLFVIQFYFMKRKIFITVFTYIICAAILVCPLMYFRTTTKAIVNFSINPFNKSNILNIILTQTKKNQCLSQPVADIILVLHKKDSAVIDAMADNYRNCGREKEADVLRIRAFRNEPLNPKYRLSYVDYLIQNHLDAELVRELDDRRLLGLHETDIPMLYDKGLDVLMTDDPGVISFWCAAAAISPTWSHIQIECASVLFKFKRQNEALSILDGCSKNIYAGQHCQEVYDLFINGNFTPPGFYCKMISNQKNLCSEKFELF